MFFIFSCFFVKKHCFFFDESLYYLSFKYFLYYSLKKYIDFEPGTKSIAVNGHF